jgi:DNA-binding response OmpR family regulator
VIYAFDDSELDLRRYELRRDGRASRIEPQVSDVLVLLVRERDRVVTKEEILDSGVGRPLRERIGLHQPDQGTAPSGSSPR